jgi:hypothetical protein
MIVVLVLTGWIVAMIVISLFLKGADQPMPPPSPIHWLAPLDAPDDYYENGEGP